MMRATETLIWWLADKFGFGVLDDGETRRALRRLAYIAAIAWGVSIAGIATGQVSPLIGMGLVTLVFVVTCGAVLISSQTNYELATMLATSEQDTLTAPDPVTAFVPPPLPPMPPVQQMQARAADPRLTAPQLPQQSQQPVAPPPKWQVLSHGEIAGRAYTIFTDGSIEIETAFGPRWFASVDLAHEFIGLRNGAALRISAAPELARVA